MLRNPCCSHMSLHSKLNCIIIHHYMSNSSRLAPKSFSNNLFPSHTLIISNPATHKIKSNSPYPKSNPSHLNQHPPAHQPLLQPLHRFSPTPSSSLAGQMQPKSPRQIPHRKQLPLLPL